MSELLSKFGVEVTFVDAVNPQNVKEAMRPNTCLLYTSDAADDSLRVDLCGRRIIKKKKKNRPRYSRHDQ
ncbi:methionine gamma-lyase [Clostridioides difficile]|nr:methionine gamma-lyase [Clostridioides difficile]